MIACHGPRPLGPPITSAGRRRERQLALSLPDRKPAFEHLVVYGSRCRRAIEQRRPPTSQPSIWPGMPAGSIYPTGYELHELGPQAH